MSPEGRSLTASVTFMSGIFFLMPISMYVLTRGIQVCSQDIRLNLKSDFISHLFIKLKHLHLTIQFHLHGPSKVAVGQLMCIISLCIL